MALFVHWDLLRSKQHDSVNILIIFSTLKSLWSKLIPRISGLIYREILVMDNLAPQKTKKRELWFMKINGFPTHPEKVRLKDPYTLKNGVGGGVLKNRDGYSRSPT